MNRFVLVAGNCCTNGMILQEHTASLRIGTAMLLNGWIQKFLTVDALQHGHPSRLRRWFLQVAIMMIQTRGLFLELRCNVASSF